ncbi:MAG: hypothetical protein RIS35_835 [Pseudomonadota bacterium]|jgi:BirA family biotin operon repressor/biotin-[acetyl-CoA-carboxylase] ligase
MIWLVKPHSQTGDAVREIAQTGREPALDASTIARAAGLAPGAVEVVDAIASTNTELMSRGLTGREVTLLAAVHQFAGRGRQGRSFLSEPGDSLTFSVALERSRDERSAPLAGLTLALGVAVAECASRHVDGVGLKWPNDLLREGRKCAGMLVEIRSSGPHDRIVIGLGLNLRVSASIASRLDQPVGGLFDDQPERMPARECLLGELARALIDAAQGFFERGFADTARRWARFDVFAGREVTILEQGRVQCVGIADGLDPMGALRLLTPTGVVMIAAGDVSARAQGPKAD